MELGKTTGVNGLKFENNILINIKLISYYFHIFFFFNFLKNK